MNRSSTCNLFIVRHGESQGNAKGLWQGHKNYNLTKKGEQQALLTKQYLNTIHFDKLQASDLIRSIHTIKLICNSSSKTIEIEPKWKELNFGHWEGKTTQEINHETDLLDFWYQNPTEAKIPGGETFLQLQARVIEAYNRLFDEIRTLAHANVLLVAHGGTIRALGCYLVGIPLSNVWQLRVNHCSVTRILVTNKKSTVVSWNHTSHLENISCKHPVI